MEFTSAINGQEMNHIDKVDKPCGICGELMNIDKLVENCTPYHLACLKKDLDKTDKRPRRPIMG